MITKELIKIINRHDDGDTLNDEKVEAIAIDIADHLKKSGVFRGSVELFSGVNLDTLAKENGYVKLSELKEATNIQELKKEYANQDNRSTAYPIYVTVQELHCVGVMKEGYNVNCPYGDGEEITEYYHRDIEGRFEDREELETAICDYYGDEEDGKKHFGEIEELTCGYIWIPVEFFLTIKGAEEYMKANVHNHGKLRTYVDHFERRNFEMREFLGKLGFKNG
jgi:hypothetical protein